MPERVRRTAQERNAWASLAIAASEIHAALPKIEPWLRQTKAWGPFKGASGIVIKMVNRLGDTLPEEQFRSLYMRLKDSELKLVPKSAVKREGWWYVSESQLEIMCAAIREDTCSMCVKANNDQRKCELRRVLEALPMRVRETAGDSCPFGLAYVEKENVSS